MPYIKKEDRKKYDTKINALVEVLKQNELIKVGDLNYIVTKLIWGLLEDSLNYSNANAIVGMLECCKLELYRRVIAKYEAQKIEENGDVY